MENYIKIEKIDHENIISGTKFKAKIEGIECEGKIFNYKINKDLYFCQDKKRGNKSPDLLGYSYSWVLHYKESLERVDIYNLYIENVNLELLDWQ